MALDVLPMEIKTYVTSGELPAGAVDARVIDRTDAQHTLRIFGFNIQYTSVNARGMQFFVADRFDLHEFKFMNRGVVGAVTQEHEWKNTFPSASAGAGALDWQHPYIDIPPAGHIFVRLEAGAAPTVLQMTVFQLELTPQIIARGLLATDVDSISVDTNNKISLNNLPPKYEFQGGPGPLGVRPVVPIG